MEKEEANCYNLVDPLAGYSGLSLFASVYGVSVEYSKPSDPEIELDYIHKHLKSEALRSPKKLEQQAKAIVDNSSELLKTKVMSYHPPENQNEEAWITAMEQPQERRPALNRKRARFSFRPDSGLTAVNLEPTLDVKQLKDPEEFFLAFERLENAKREIKRQMGTDLTDLNQLNSSTMLRHRRPGILGRSVKYKHQFSSVVSKNDGNDVFSQEKDRSRILSQTNPSSQQGPDQNISLHENDCLDSPTNSENQVRKVLDELLSDNCKDLEGDEAISFLKERLQIKPIELEKLSLPELQDNKTIYVKSSRGNFTKPQNSLSQIQNLMRGKAPLAARPKSSVLSKSPFSSFTSLQKRILQPKPLNDQFSAHDIDDLPARNLSLLKDISKQRSPSNTGKQSSASPRQLSPLHAENAVGSDENGSNEVTERFNYYSKLSGMENSLKGDAINNVENCMIESLPKTVMEKKSRTSKVQADDIIGNYQGVAQRELNATPIDSTEEHLSTIPQEFGELPSATVMEDHAMHELEEAVDQNDEPKEIQESQLTLQKQRTGRSLPHKDKKCLRRQSLAAGTAWECGKRQSTGIRVRPLEFWKGERLLYGRIHQSLATVIGVKYASPSKSGGKSTMKVKSYVHKRYKELVEHAALH